MNISGGLKPHKKTIWHWHNYLIWRVSRVLTFSFIRSIQVRHIYCIKNIYKILWFMFDILVWHYSTSIPMFCCGGVFFQKSSLFDSWTVGLETTPHMHYFRSFSQVKKKKNQQFWKMAIFAYLHEYYTNMSTRSLQETRAIQSLVNVLYQFLLKVPDSFVFKELLFGKTPLQWDSHVYNPTYIKWYMKTASKVFQRGVYWSLLHLPWVDNHLCRIVNVLSTWFSVNVLHDINTRNIIPHCSFKLPTLLKLCFREYMVLYEEHPYIGMSRLEILH